MPLTIEPGETKVMPWTLRTGNPGAFSQQIHLWVGLDDVLIEHEIPVQGTFAAAK